MSSTTEKFEQWCIVEVMGHNRFAGFVSEQTIGGTAFVRIDVPAIDDKPPFTKYFGSAVGQPLEDPLHTVTGKPRFALLEIMQDHYVMVDIGMRMLTPRELARAQGFPEDYILVGSKANQVAKIGNSVCPVMAEVLARANYVGITSKRRRKAVLSNFTEVPHARSVPQEQ